MKMRLLVTHEALRNFERQAALFVKPWTSLKNRNPKHIESYQCFAEVGYNPYKDDNFLQGPFLGVEFSYVEKPEFGSGKYYLYCPLHVLSVSDQEQSLNFDLVKFIEKAKVFKKQKNSGCFDVSGITFEVLP